MSYTYNIDEMYKILLSNTLINDEIKKIKDEISTLSGCGSCDTYIAYTIINERTIQGLKNEIYELKKLLSILITNEEERGALKISKQ
jgi:hypothetical protein